MRLLRQYFAQWSSSLVYVSKPRRTLISAIVCAFLYAYMKSNRLWQSVWLNVSYNPRQSLLRQIDYPSFFYIYVIFVPLHEENALPLHPLPQSQCWCFCEREAHLARKLRLKLTWLRGRGEEGYHGVCKSANDFEFHLIVSTVLSGILFLNPYVMSPIDA